MSLDQGSRIVASNPIAELSRQQIKRNVHWDCPVLGYDPGANQQPPGMLWIRSDINKSSMERYRFYDENGNVVTLADVDSGSSSSVSVALVRSMVNDVAAPDEVKNTAVETDLATKYTIPGGTAAVADVYCIHAYGVYRSDALVSANFVLRLYFAGSLVMTSDSIAAVAPTTNAPWSILCDAAVASIGNSGTVYVHGRWQAQTGAGASTVEIAKNFGTGFGGGYAFATLSDADIKISVDWDTADVDDSVQLIIFNVAKKRVL